jgi:uncharacterized protein with FMN-binding domain
LQKYAILYCFLLIVTIIGCQTATNLGGEVGEKKLRDGIYEGSYSNGPNSVVVKVTITDNRIEDVDLLRHFASWKGNKANTVIPRRIVEEQSTRVDAVSGATNSSIVIMNAAQKAIEQAYE